MSLGNVDAILNGSYAFAIMDALGSATAWTHVSISADTSNAAPSAASAPSSILSLSPLAQKIANGGEIALQVLDAASGRKPAAVTSLQAAPPGTTWAKSADAGQAAAWTPAGAPSIAPAVLAAEDAAKQALTDPKALFDALVSRGGGAARWSQWFGDAAQQQAFVAAFASGDVTTQSAATVKGLDYTDATVIWGGGETGDITVDQNWQKATDAANDTYSVVFGFPAVGGVYVTFPKGQGIPAPSSPT